jgi:hypothetical protein
MAVARLSPVCGMSIGLTQSQRRFSSTCQGPKIIDSNSFLKAQNRNRNGSGHEQFVISRLNKYHRSTTSISVEQLDFELRACAACQDFPSANPSEKPRAAFLGKG